MSEIQVQKRYFTVSYAFYTGTKSGHGFISFTADTYPSFAFIKRTIDLHNPDQEIVPIVITELSENDYDDFKRDNKERE